MDFAANSDAAKEILEKKVAELQKALDDRDRRPSLVEVFKYYDDTAPKLFEVEPEPARRTTGSIQDPANKLHPKELKEWDDCPSELRNIYGELQALLDEPDCDPQFESFEYMWGLAEHASPGRIGTEADFATFQGRFFEMILMALYRSMAAVPKLKDHFRLKDRLSIDSSGNSHLADQRATRPDSGNEARSEKVCADRFYYEAEGNQKRLILTTELKPPHKMPMSVWSHGLGEMELDPIIHVSTSPTDPQLREQQSAFRKVASVLTQEFDYMIRGGMLYGCVDSGEAAVFLKITSDNPATLYYHFLGGIEKNAPTESFDPYRSDLARRFLFTLLAARGERMDRDWIANQGKALPEWRFDPWMDHGPWPDRMDHPDNIRPFTPSISISKIQDKQHQTRSPTKGGSKSCKPDQQRPNPDDEEDPDDKPPSTFGPPNPSSQNLQTANKQRTIGGGGNTSVEGSYSKNNTLNLAYCTQECLKGLRNGTALHESCPNVELHCPSTQKSRSHPFPAQQLPSRVQTQLAESLVQGVTDLGLQGARGKIFKISLVSHGYTFIAKGTSLAYKPDLEHEARVYQRLKQLQGEIIPFWLGSINLVRPWIDLNAWITYMLLLSYGGEEIGSGGLRERDRQEQESIVSQLTKWGVKHKDLSVYNLLRNMDTGHLMIVDFERSELDPLPSGWPPEGPSRGKLRGTMPLSEMSGNASPSRQPSQERSMHYLPTKASKRSKNRSGPKDDPLHFVQ